MKLHVSSEESAPRQGKSRVRLFRDWIWLLLGLAAVSSVQAQVNVTTVQNDIGRTGQNINETILTPANVNATQFGKIFAQPVDGYVYAQPLYLSNLTVNGATHNVVFVATEHDSVYAFDADSTSGTNSAPLWFASMLTAAHGAAAGATTIPTNASSDIAIEYGITGTPVIDPATGTLYVVSATIEGGKEVQRLHALDVTTGSEKSGGPVVIAGSVAGSGPGSVNGTLTFTPSLQLQRPGLLLLNGIVYIGYTAHMDSGSWHGWVFGYNAATLTRTGVFCTTPNALGGGIWMSGAGLAADRVDPLNHPYGRMFVPTGNGDGAAAPTPPYDATMNYAESHLALDLTNGAPAIADEFTTNQHANYDKVDDDVGAGGLLVLPDQPGSVPHVLVQTSKPGVVYVLNRDNLGGYNATTDQAWQELTGLPGFWSSPAYWNGQVYLFAQNDRMKAFPIVNGKLSTPTLSQDSYPWPGATPVISANGNTQGIVWTIDSSGYQNFAPSVLRARDASNVTNILYNSSTNPTRDAAGKAVKFAIPTIANGKVYVGTGDQLDVYGLLSGTTQTSVPAFSPGSQLFSGSISITITDANSSANIYYTTDGTPATMSSTPYAGPITLTSTTTIRALAIAPGLTASGQGTATYTVAPQAATPTFSPTSGTYSVPQTVTISDATSGATIYYTVDGTTPTIASKVYGGPITVSASQTVKAAAISPGRSLSPVGFASYVIGQTVATPAFSPVAGTYASAQTVTISDATTGAAIYYTTDGSTPTSASAPYSSAITVSASQTIKAIAINGANSSTVASAAYSIGSAPSINYASGFGAGGGLALNGGAAVTGGVLVLTDGGSGEARTAWAANPVNIQSFTTDFTFKQVSGTADGFTFAIQSAGTAAVGGNGGALGYAGIGTSVAVKFDIYDNAGEGTNSTGFYTNGAMPTLPALDMSASGILLRAGNTMAAHVAYDGTTLTLALSDTITGSSYTASSVINIPNVVGGSTAYVGFTGGTGGLTSTQEILTWTFASNSSGGTTPTAATPTFSPAAGAYAAAQTVTISDTTSGATIYYTTDNSVPTTSSAVYNSPITVSTSQTVKAIAVATGYKNSAVGTAAYTINGVTATPTFSPLAGAYSSAQTVTISDATTGATIYYTTDGTTPTTSSTVYSAPITVAASQTVNAIATAAAYGNSAVGSATYSINGVAVPTFSPVGGSFGSPTVVTISETTTGAVIYYTTDGTVPTATSAVYSGPITVSASQSIKAIAVANSTSSAVGSAIYTIGTAPSVNYSSGFGSGTGLSFNGGAAVTGGALVLTDGGFGEARSAWGAAPVNVLSFTTDFTFQQTSAIADGFTFAIQNAGAGALGGNGGALGYAGMGTSVAVKFDIYSNAGEGTDSTGVYTNGATPTVPSTDMTASGVVLRSGDTMAAHLTYNGTTLTLNVTDTVTGATFTTSSAINISSMVGGNTAYVGFTGGTGGLSATQKILTWTFANTSSGGTTPATTPTFSPAGGAYASAQTVTISDTTNGATIYYTTDGTTPTTSATVYSAPITVSTSQTVKAIAAASGYGNSTVGSAAYTINGAAATPTFSPVAGTYAAAQTVTISDTTSGATIYYTTDGTTPMTSSAVYSAPITVSTSQTVKAIAAATGYGNSAVGMVAYTINGSAATPTFSPVAGTYTSAQTVTISDAMTGATIYYTTDGTTPTTSSTVYSVPITVVTSQTVKAIATATGYGNSAVGIAAYSINGTAATPTFSPVAGAYASAQTVTISDTTAGATIYYTTDGTTPTTSSTVYSAPITVSVSQTVKAIAAAGGYGTSAVGAAAYTINGPAATPTFSPVAGAYASAQTVTISDATTGTTIYYTTDGTTPTTSSPVYGAPITVSASQTVKAIAAAAGYATSGVGAAVYTINGPAATPTFSPVAGTYGGAQTVTISDATTGATIYYTTDGTTPTMSSTVYSAPITVSTSKTVKAIAAAAGYATSGVGAAVYTINGAAATPTFSPVAGTYAGTQTVTITDTTAGATIYYTTNGATPTTSSTVYSAPITVSTSQTVEAIAVAAGYATSAVASASYTIGTAPSVNYSSGFSSGSALYLNGGTSVAGGALVLTNGGGGQARSAWAKTPVNVLGFTTDFTFQQTSAIADGFIFAIQNAGPLALGGNGWALGYAGIAKSVAVKFDIYSNAGEGTDSTGFYTNGANPTVPATDMTGSGIVLRSGDTMAAHLTYDGTTLALTLTDTVTGATFTTSSAINIPSVVGSTTAYVGFTGGTGGLSSTQKVLTWTYASH